jgi:hypothetical protein
MFNRDGSDPRRKSPANIFTETDIYTIEQPDGGRDLRLEHGLQELEDKFTRIRNLTFSRGIWPDAGQMAVVYAFIATAQARTQTFRDHHAAQWGELRQRMEDLEEAMLRATPAQRDAMRAATPVGGGGPGMGIEHVRELEANPIQMTLAPFLRNVLPVYAQMHMAVLCTADPLGFVATDTPCTWTNPNAHRMQPLFRAPGLGMRNIEVTLPISPRQCLLITHHPDMTGFREVDQRVVDEANRSHIAHCDQYFIASSDETRPVWFEHRPMPEDAWENLHEVRARAQAEARGAGPDALA